MAFVAAPDDIQLDTQPSGSSSGYAPFDDSKMQMDTPSVADNINSSIQQARSGQINPVAAGIQGTGDWMGAGAQKVGNAISQIPLPNIANQSSTVGDVAKTVSNGLKNAADYGVNALRAPAQSVANAIDSPTTEQYAQTAGDVASDFTQNHPSYTASMKGGANILAGLGALEGVTNVVPTARSMMSSVTQSAADSLAASKAANIAANISSLKAPIDRNLQYIEGMNANAENMKQTASNIYDKAGEISQGVTRNEPAMQKNVNALLDNMKDDPAHQGVQGTSQAYRDLNAVNDSFDKNGDIPLDSLTLLQRRVNDLYSPDMSADRAKIYNTLNTQLRQANQRAATDNPEWGDMMDSGNKLHANYKDTFVNDKATDSIWSADDKAAYEKANATNADPLGAGISTDTRNKIYNLPSNVQNLAQYEATLRKLPTALQEPFTQDVIAAQKSNAPSAVSKIYNAYKATQGSPSGIVKSLYNLATKGSGTEINPALANSAPHVEDAINHYGNKAGQAYGKYLNDTQAAQEATQNFTAPAQSNNASYFNTELPVNKSQSMVAQLSPQERLAAQANVLQRAATRNTPIADAKSQALSAAKLTPEIPPAAPIKSLQDIAPSNYSDTLAKEAENERIAEEQMMMQMQGPYNYKSGGAVNISPSDKQIASGNYKKDHVKIHGLNVTIENPKGSIRRGMSKDGKQWQVQMPASYGYLKGTIGADGSHLDCFIGPNEKSRRVYVIDQKDASTGNFDEHKIIFYVSDRSEAEKLYKSAYFDNKNRIMGITRMSIPELKDWLKHGNTRIPVKRK